MFERHRVGRIDRVARIHLQAEHHHPRDPEEDYVECGYQQARRIVLLELDRPLGPSECGKWPQAGRKPRIEHVLVLTQVAATASPTNRRPRLRYDGLRVGASLAPVGGGAMAPPELARDAPVLQITHPGEISILPLLRKESGIALLHRRNRSRRDRLAT